MVYEPPMVKVIKAGRLMCFGHFSVMQDEGTCRKPVFHKPEGCRRVVAFSARRF
jgi:hypothetical protein